MKQIGERAGTTDDTGTQIIDFVVTSIKPRTSCKPTESDAGKPDNGTFLFVTIDVTTTPAYVADKNKGFFSPFSWQTIGADGVTQADLVTPQIYGCAESRNGGLPDTMAPGSKYRGTVVLDTSSASGTLVLRTSGTTSLKNISGWEWTY